MKPNEDMIPFVPIIMPDIHFGSEHMSIIRALEAIRDTEICLVIPAVDITNQEHRSHEITIEDLIMAKNESSKFVICGVPHSTCVKYEPCFETTSIPFTNRYSEPDYWAPYEEKRRKVRNRSERRKNGCLGTSEDEEIYLLPCDLIENGLLHLRPQNVCSSNNIKTKRYKKLRKLEKFRPNTKRRNKKL